MDAKTKNILAISTGVVAVGVGAYFVFKAIRNKLPIDSPVNSTRVITDTGESLETKIPPLQDTPFTNQQEGNDFRKWVNDNYPYYAEIINLDREGLMNNVYIKRAWAKYGSQYELSKNGAVVKPTPNDFEKLKSVLSEPTFVVSTNESELLQVSSGEKRPNILVDFYPDSTMIVQKDRNLFAPLYDRISGSWKIVNNDVVLNLNGKDYTLKTSDALNVFTNMLKDAGYISANNQFVPFVNDKKQKTLTKNDMELSDNSLETLL
ncbi:hypothetical protein EBU94_02085 [bacterium]|nr:hypothetical protein [bacterium]